MGKEHSGSSINHIIVNVKSSKGNKNRKVCLWLILLKNISYCDIQLNNHKLISKFCLVIYILFISLSIFFVDVGKKSNDNASTNIFSLSHASNYRMREMRFDRLLRATQRDYIFFSFQEHNLNGFENIYLCEIKTSNVTINI